MQFMCLAPANWETIKWKIENSFDFLDTNNATAAQKTKNRKRNIQFANNRMVMWGDERTAHEHEHVCLINDYSNSFRIEVIQ